MPEPKDGVVDEPTVTIEEEAGTVEETSNEFVLDGLTTAEVELAKKHGFVEKKADEKADDEANKEQTDGGDKEQSESGDKDIEGDKEVTSPTFEQIEANEKLIDKYGKNEKALYWKWKTDKHKRQEAQKEAETLRNKLKEAVDSGISGKKLEKVKALLKNPDNLTIEALQAAIDEQVEPEKKAEDLDNAQVIQQKVAIKAQFAEKIGSAKYDNFTEISKLAKEIITSDKSGTYQKLIDDSFLNDEVDENMLVERVVNIARISPKFNEVANQVKPEDKEKVDRVIKNSNKKVSSASLNGASGKRVISESELTPEQAAKLSTSQWNALKPETKRRLMGGS